ncbi:MAG: hypothetical protein ABEN55_12525, partial [Bradymonadaceae bacterium]
MVEKRDVTRTSHRWLVALVLVALMGAPDIGTAQQQNGTGSAVLAWHVDADGPIADKLPGTIRYLARKHHFETEPPSSTRAAVRLQFGGADEKLSGEQLQKLRKALEVDVVVHISAKSIQGSETSGGTANGIGSGDPEKYAIGVRVVDSEEIQQKFQETHSANGEMFVADAIETMLEPIEKRLDVSRRREPTERPSGSEAPANDESERATSSTAAAGSGNTQTGSEAQASNQRTPSRSAADERPAESGENRTERRAGTSAGQGRGKNSRAASASRVPAVKPFAKLGHGGEFDSKEGGSADVEMTHVFGLEVDFVSIQEIFQVGARAEYGFWALDGAENRNSFLSLAGVLKGSYALSPDVDLYAAVPVGGTKSFVNSENKTDGQPKGGFSINLGIYGGFEYRFADRIGVFGEVGWWNQAVKFTADAGELVGKFQQ